MRVLGRRPRQLTSQENLARRAHLPCPRPVPFLLVGDRLICPWEAIPGDALPTWQTEQLVAVRAVLASVERLPRLAWVTAEAITPMTEPVEASWLARRRHDGTEVPLVATC